MTEDRRAIIFVGIILNILLLNQPVTSNVKTEPGVSEYRIRSRVYERISHPNSSVTNQRFEIERRRLNFYRFKREISGRISNVRLYPFVEFFSTEKSAQFQFERKRRILRERRNYRQQRRAIINRPYLSDQIQRLDNRRRIMYSEGKQRIRRDTYSRFLNLELTSARTILSNRDRIMNLRFRNTRNSEFLLYESRENIGQFRTRRQRSMRTIHTDGDQNSNLMFVKNSEISSPAHSFFESSLFHYFPDSLPSNLITDFVMSSVAAVLLYDLMEAMTQSNAGAVKKGSLGNLVEKMASIVQKVTVH